MILFYPHQVFAESLVLVMTVPPSILFRLGRDPSQEYIYKKDRQCHEKLFPFLVQKTLTNQVPFVRPQDPSVKLNNQSQAKLIDLGDP